MRGQETIVKTIFNKAEQEKTVEFESFDIIWVESCNYPIDSGIQPHRHDFFHFILVENGEGAIVVGQMEYPLREGMLFPIPAQTEHAFYNRGNEPLQTLELKFRLADAAATRKAEALPLPMRVDGFPVREGLLALYREAHGDAPLRTKVISLQFELFMAYLMRCKECLLQTDVPKGKSMKISPEIESAVSYIREHLTEELSLSVLAEVARFEKNYFLRKFKRQLGCTPIRYILGKRMEKAKELLRFSDMNITQIANAVGFKDIHYFSKVFYDYMKERPSEYRTK